MKKGVSRTRARSEARQRALQAVYQWQLTGQTVGTVENQFLTEGEMGKADPDYFRELLRLVADNTAALDAHITPHLDRPIAQVDPVEAAILRLGAAELKFRPDVPYRVVINEAIELAKTFGGEQGHKYVNSILDRVAAELRAAEIAARKRGN